MEFKPCVIRRGEIQKPSFLEGYAMVKSLTVSSGGPRGLVLALESLIIYVQNGMRPFQTLRDYFREDIAPSSSLFRAKQV